MLKKICIIILLITIFFNYSTVYSDDFEEETDILNWQEEILQASSEDINEPNINSRAAIVYDRDSKKIIWGKQENERRPMASTTKIMTAIVVLENTNLTEKVKVSKKAAGTGGSRLGLKTDDEITVNDLLYGLLLVSGNDAAVALAEHVGGSIEGFAEKMNTKAKELELKDTSFVTPHGLDKPEHYTTAFELAKMADYALNIKKFAEIVNTKTCTVYINKNPKNLRNTNELLGNLYGVNGVKTGFTNGANRCLVTSVDRENMNIITVVLGADTKKFRTTDSIKLIEYAYENYEIYNLKEIVNDEYEKWKNINEKRIEINKGKNTYIETKLESIDNYLIPIKKKDKEKLNVKIYNLENLEAPIEKGTYIGKLCVYIGEEKIMDINILSNTKVVRLNFIDYLLNLYINNISYMEKSIK